MAADEDKVKASKIEVDQEVEKFDGVIKENKSRAQHWKKQVRGQPSSGGSQSSDGSCLNGVHKSFVWD